ncbi:MAG: hypothetical protein HYY03_01060 [Chloroflexi bacterium]|nr:hypothetical protein [Chloroflexota bacterium]
MRYWLKQCPRCRGDLRQESDIYGYYISCVQCGYILNQAEEARVLTAGILGEPFSVVKAA